jgi:hypothetical protein
MIKKLRFFLGRKKCLGKNASYPIFLIQPEKKYPSIILSIYMIFIREKPYKMSRISGLLPEYTRCKFLFSYSHLRRIYAPFTRTSDK